MTIHEKIAPKVAGSIPMGAPMKSIFGWGWIERTASEGGPYTSKRHRASLVDIGPTL